MVCGIALQKKEQELNTVGLSRIYDKNEAMKRVGTFSMIIRKAEVGTRNFTAK